MLYLVATRIFAWLVLLSRSSAAKLWTRVLRCPLSGPGSLSKPDAVFLGAVLPDRCDDFVNKPAGGLVWIGAGQREHDVLDAGGGEGADVGAGGGGVGVVDDDLRGAGDRGGVAADRGAVRV